MKSVKLWESIDGSRFTDRKDAVIHNLQLKARHKQAEPLVRWIVFGIVGHRAQIKIALNHGNANKDYIDGMNCVIDNLFGITCGMLEALVEAQESEDESKHPWPDSGKPISATRNEQNEKGNTKRKRRTQRDNT